MAEFGVFHYTVTDYFYDLGFLLCFRVATGECNITFGLLIRLPVSWDGVALRGSKYSGAHPTPRRSVNNVIQLCYLSPTHGSFQHI